MYTSIKDQLRTELDDIRSAGLFKTERRISPATSPPDRSGSRAPTC